MTVLACACGKVEYEATEPAILSVACYCDDCQEGGRRIEALPNAPPVLDADGGTACVLYRKDRVRCTHGAELVTKLKLREKTATNRLVATCCNSALAISFDDSKHWMPLFRSRLRGGARPLAKVVGDGLAVGALTGFVGVGGGFLILPALVLLDAVARYVPGVLGSVDSARRDSFAEGLKTFLISLHTG